jgi:tryptophan synthase beta chain
VTPQDAARKLIQLILIFVKEEPMTTKASSQTRFLLGEEDLPKFWYNINADSPVPPAPVLHPATMEPVTPDFLSVLFPMDLILQEISTERYIEIPQEVREIYKLYRPTPLLRARRLEKALGTPAHIYYKHEGVSPVGSHKPNTAIAQAFYNKIAGTKALTTETGAGQWGSALALAGSFFDMDIEVYMVKVSYNQKPYRRVLMETFGAQVFASPTDRTNYGRALLAENPDNPGSLGIAISEAVEVAATSGGAKKYSLGSVLNHVLLHQTVIGEEALKQMDMAGEYPDVVIGRHPLTDQRPVHFRLWRYRSHGPHRQNAYLGACFRAPAHSRRRPALSRDGPQHLRPV